MREIKFRTWSKNTKQMSEVLNDTQEFRFSDTSYITLSQAFRHSDDYILMQYTGLKDKNGKEIYESDIVKIDGENYEIKWWSGQFVYQKKELDFKSEPQYVNFGWWTNSNNYTNQLIQIEIIGNIYSNPELV